MQITHAEAHRLIQYHLDRALNSEKQKVLFAHLQECEACRAYDDRMQDIENMLREVMNHQWHDHPLPLSINSIRARKIDPKRTYSQFGLRAALASIVLVAFSFLIWGLTMTAYNPPEQVASNILSVPTPSIQLSTTSIEAPKCKWSLHKVHAAETLETIAHQYFVSTEEIMTFNNMTSKVIYESMELKIPHCDVTPTVTAHMPTRTLTPSLESTMNTQGNLADGSNFH